MAIPTNPNAPSPAERKRASRARGASRILVLPAAVLAALKTMRTRDGDPWLVTCVESLIKETAHR